MQRLLLFVMLVAVSAGAQPPDDSAFVDASVRYALTQYRQALGAQSLLYNGSRYVAGEYSLDQHPYLGTPDWVDGTVFYDGELFENVPLMYDLDQGAVVTEHRPTGQPIQLVDEKLLHFTLAGHHFEKIDNASVGNSLPHSGFYDILYPGETRVIARREKLMSEEIEATSVTIEYEQKNKYFIFRNGVFFPVRSKSSVLKVMSDKKQDIKKFLKRQPRPFGKNREVLLERMAAYYDSLK